MSAQDRAIQKLARDLASMKKELVSWRGPQADYTSIENGGNFTFKDGDGNVTGIIGGQDDGSTTVRHVDGPTPPIPSGLSAHVDGPIIQVSWDGTFEDADNATYDWSHLEVIVVGPSNEQLTATINDVTGASTSVAATASGEWTVVARSVSRAEKRSLDGDAGTVEVKLVDIDGAIEAVQDSANGKNKVTYSEFAPTPADPGIFDDTWFVGQVGRPEDVIEGKNRVRNPSAVPTGTGWSTRAGNPTTMSATTRGGMSCFRATTVSGSSYVYLVAAADEFNPSALGDVVAGEVISAGMLVACSGSRSLSLRMGFRDSDGTFIAWSNIGPSSAVPANGALVQLKLENQMVPAGATQVYVHVTNSTPAGAGDWVEGTRAFITQGATLPAYFDGDTPSGATDNEPHYRWTGTTHASTSEKYLPALTIGDSDNWNIIEQYRHDGTGWVRVELSHKVFSSVDLGKATVGELDGIRIMGQTVRGEQLSGDAIDGKVITGPIIQSARDGQRWVGDTTGIRIFNADNEVRTKLSPDDSVFKGEVEADTLIVNGGSELRSTENKLAQGAKLTLEAGVTDPTAPPTVQPYWDSAEFTSGEVNGVPMKSVGLAWDGTNYWTAHSRAGVSGRSSRILGFRIDVSTGSADFVDITIPHGTPWHSEVFGVTCIGSELFWLGRSKYDGYVWVTDLAGAFKRAFAYPDLGYSSSNPLKYKPGIGNNGTDVIIAQCADDGTLVTRTYNKTTGVRTIVRDMSPVGFNSDVLGVYVGAADWGGGTFITVAGSTRKLLTYSSAGVYDASKTFPMPDGSQDTGVVFQGGKFRTLNASGVIHEYADNNTGDASSDWWATYRWSVDADDDGFNDYASRIGPVKKFTWPLRAKLRFMGAPLPAGVGYITPSIAKKATSPVRTDFRTPSFSVHAGESTAFISILPTNWQSGAAPGDSNDFPDAEPSTLVSASSTFQVNGDGSGKWGPLTFNANGTVSGIPMQATGSTTIGVSAAAGNTANVTVTLPWGAFTTPPRIFLTKQGDTLAKYNPYATSITTTSFTLGLYSGDSSSTTNSVSVAWHAIGGV